MKVPAGFPGGSEGKASAYDAGDPGLILGLGRSPGEGNSNPLQCSCLENPMEKSLAGSSPWGCKEPDTTEQLTLYTSKGSSYSPGISPLRML